ncbi:hypothetical protein BTE77_27900 [Ensifer adhaerens]|nr:hypothetical protein BTE77_27900 [Ensifer adhaerens]
MAPNYKDFVDQNVRLVILKALALESHASLNDALIEYQLQLFGYNRTREYLRNQLRWLENEAGAIRIEEHGSAWIATLTRTGRYHVERKCFLEGVQRPGDVD